MGSCLKETALFLIIAASNVFGQEWIGCYSTQYAEIGFTGFIHCTFPTAFKAVYWYDDVTNPAANPLLSYTREYTELGSLNVVKSGYGYDSGDFNVMLNGSLIITKVSLQHEKMFKALCIDSSDIGRTFVVSLIVTVSPTQENPVVKSCEGVEQVCVIYANSSQHLTCEFHGARPPVNLDWEHRFPEVDVTMESVKSIKNETVTFCTKAVLDISSVGDELLLFLVCKAKYFVSKWSSEAEVLVDLSRRKSFYENEPSVIYSEVNGQVTIPSPSELSRRSILLWKMGNHESEKTIAFSVLGRTQLVKDYEGTFSINSAGELVITAVTLSHEGLYTSIYSDEIEDIVAVVNLVILVHPSPPHLVVSGCSRQNTGCSIEGQSGSLSCSVHNVRPMVTLEWSTTSSHIRFSPSKHKSEELNGLFDISETVVYHLSDETSCKEYVEVLCKAFGPPAAIFQSSTTLQIRPDPANCSKESMSPSKSSSAAAISIAVLLPAFAVVGVVIIAGLCFHSHRKTKRRRIESENGPSSEEAQPLTEDISKEKKEIKEIKERLIKELKNHYASKFDDEDIYLPRKLSLIKTRKHPGGELVVSSSPLDSYHCIFESTSLEYKDRIIIEGGTGYGKTLFAFHMARDWCRDAKESPLCDIDIFILISLKGVDDTTSIYDSITQQLLSERCGLKGKDVKAILDQEEKFVVVLDHYHEYYERKKVNAKDGKEGKDVPVKETFVDKIMSSKMLQNAKVIVLSLSSPTVQENIYGKGPTVVRIEKFTPDQVDEYLNHVFGDEHKKRERFKKQISQNREISELCDIPLFLKMISESYKNSKGEQLRFNKISNFFEDWFKLKHKRSVGNETFDVSEWKEIAKIAIEGIMNRQTVWTKKEFISRTEKDCFKMFEKMGVIVETKFHVDSTTQKDTHHQSKQENNNVKFIHTIYQQFMGAHYLAFHAEANQFEEYLSFSTLPKNTQLIVFACGLNNKKVIDVVKFFLKEGNTLELRHENLIYSCFYEVENLDEDEMKGVLESVLKRFHGIVFREDDSNSIRLGKVSSVEAINYHKIEIPSITFMNAAKNITEDSITLLNCNGKIITTTRVRAYVINDEHGNIQAEDIMKLVEAASCVETIVVTSCFSPSETVTTNDFKQKLYKEKQLCVTWITNVLTEDDEGIMTSYPSSKLGKWINFEKLLLTPDETDRAEVSRHQSTSKDIMGFFHSILRELQIMDNAREQTKANSRHKIEKVKNQLLEKLQKEKIRLANDNRIMEFKEGNASMYGDSLSSKLYWYRWIYFLHKAIEEGKQ